MMEYKVELIGRVEGSADQEPGLKDALRMYKLFSVNKIGKIVEDSSDKNKYSESRARTLLDKRPYVLVTPDHDLRAGGQFALMSKVKSKEGNYAYPTLKIFGSMTLDENTYSSVSVNGVEIID